MLPHQAQALVRALGLEATLEDPRYKDVPYFGSAEDAEAWETLAWEAFRARPWAEWRERLFAEGDISFELHGTAEDGLEHPQIQHNHEVVEVVDPDVGLVREVAPVARFERTPALVARSAPRLGEHGPLPTRPVAPIVAGTGPAPAHPLAGVTIVEFGYFYAMPYGVTLAAALGARVVKLEDRTGDPMRSGFGPPEVTGVKTTEGKESLSLDLRSTEGQEIAHKLIARSDAFVHGFRSGIPDRLGLGYETLSALNPRLVYFEATGYGTTGPYAARPIFAQEAAVVAGASHRHAGFWLNPELSESMSVPELQAVIQPRLRGQTPGDAYSALAACTGIVLALLEQRRSGEGQRAGRTMIGSNALGFADDFISYAGKTPVAIPDAENLGYGPLYRLYRTPNGWVFLAVTSPKEWDALVATIGGDLGADARFATEESRAANADALAKALGDAFALKGAGEWERLLTPRGVACVEAFETTTADSAAASMGGMAEFTYTDPVIRETGLVAEIDHPIFGRILRHGPPSYFSETPARVAPGCRVGQHTDAILAELGYADDEIAKLHAAEVVFGP
jgi:crotonobetainyl-CoA:carnitine CoA-transferase CaiB-like acyl-CoA transferase